MTYKEYKALPKLVKIIDVENVEDEAIKEMLGGIFEVRCDYYHDKTLNVWNKDKSNHWFFNENQVQRMTPVKFKGEYIGEGDKIISKFGYNCTVTEYFYDESGIMISTLDKDKVRRSFYVNQIEYHTPLYPNNKIELTNE